MYNERTIYFDSSDKIIDEIKRLSSENNITQEFALQIVKLSMEHEHRHIRGIVCDEQFDIREISWRRLGTSIECVGNSIMCTNDK